MVVEIETTLNNAWRGAVGKSGYSPRAQMTADALSLTLQLGQDNVGARLLTPDSGITIKDAYANYRASNTVQVVVGQFKVPFLRANLESGFNQLLVDRGTVPTLRPAREGSRDLGMMLWGNAGGLQYRVAAFDGSDQDGSSTESSLRLTTRIAHNWFAREPGLAPAQAIAGAQVHRHRACPA